MIQKHIHRLRRHKYQNGAIIYFCVLDCSFKIDRKLALGKTAQCWKCLKSFTMTESSIRLAKPHCTSCSKPKDEKEGEIKIHESNDPTSRLSKELELVKIPSGNFEAGKGSLADNPEDDL